MMWYDEDVLCHVGVGHEDDPPGRGSGRYAYGSGDNPGQHQFTFLSEVDRLKKEGLTQTEIAETLLGPGKNSTNLRAEISIANSELRQINRSKAIKLLDECKGNVSEVARRMGKNESSVRSLLDPVKAERADRYQNTAEMLKKACKEQGGMIDVGKDTELYLGVTDSTKKVAIAILEKEGYLKSWVNIPQITTGHETTTIVLAEPGYTHSDVQKNKFDLKPIQTFTPDEGKTWWTPEFPESIDSKRVMIRYKEDGGAEKDGVIELRRGVEDISLGKSQYAQVRIAVDDSHYMKGMAMYADNMPDGVDVIYNSNKKRGTPMMLPDDNATQVLKPMKKNATTSEIDRDNPFGALIKGPKDRDGVVTAGGQRHYIDKDGKEKLSPINKLQDEGDWDSWSRNLASQFLSKQPQRLIDQQINLTLADKRDELNNIMNLTNPVIKKKLLDQFANNCDKKASELSVKGVKNQAFQVILPITNMKDNEIYAPNYDDGDTVALVRYPHGGTFEIPVLKVNNKQKTAKSVMGGARDAVGINAKVAERLSGADFDGDTALVIPLASNKLKVTSTPALDGLKGFDGKELYKLPDSAPRIKNDTKQNQMGQVTNLITDMTVLGATEDEICRAVKHSMVVIDSEKHHLDYKKSAKDNNISALKKEYQGSVNPKTGKTNTGASTILSRAGAEVYVPRRKEVTNTAIMTPEELKRWNRGDKVYRNTGETSLKLIKDTSEMTSEELKAHNAGKKVYRQTDTLKTEKVPRMDLVDDARSLVRDKTNGKEMAYANYANELKEMGRKARKESRSIKPIPVNTQARKTYAQEVDSLNAKLRQAKLNNPKERTAQAMANAQVRIKFQENPDMDFEHRQRAKQVALTQARAAVGAKKDPVVITDREWEAIQANAISTNKLSEILDNTDQEAFKKRATPKANAGATLTTTQIAKAKAMYSSGMYTQKEIAEALGVSASTVSAAVRS